MPRQGQSDFRFKETFKMTNGGSPVNSLGMVNLKNVFRFVTLVETVLGRGPNMPGIGVFHGYSGYGKTYAAALAANMTQARVVEVGDSWTRKKLLLKILHEAIEKEDNVPSRGSVSDLTEQVIDVLSDTVDRPLIIDEADKLADKGMLELVREIQDQSRVALLLIGEENLPAKLERVERVHNRVLEWVPAEKCDFEDAGLLAGLICDQLELSDCLIDGLIEKSGGRARRITVNLNRIKEHARNTRQTTYTFADFNENFFYTGKPTGRTAKRAA
ncbi:transposase protein B [Roseibium sp. TrichSKD4]|nr:transposase protein B [Roseibium sp. TrichSKD4]